MQRSKQRILVTGASRGIGRAIAQAASTGGHDIAILGRASADLDATAEMCEAAGSDVLVVHADVTEPSSVTGSCLEVIERWGGLDALVNNAGMGRYAPFMELDDSDWSQMLNTNVLGVVNVTRALLPTMTTQGHGHIVNICSIRGLETIPGTTAYAASKFALVGMGLALRQELEGTGVLVSMIYPGGVKTDFGGIRSGTKDPSFLEPEAIAKVTMSILDEGPAAWIRDVTIMPAPAHG